MSGLQYSVQWQNQSSDSGNVFMFQRPPDIGVPNVFSLAWFSKYAWPTARGIFSWADRLQFCLG